MNFRIICIGKLKEQYLRDAEGEYFKRLSRFGVIYVTELKDSPVPAVASRAEEDAAKRTEGAAILKVLGSMNRNKHYVIALDRGGKDLSSEELAGKLSSLAAGGKSTVVFIIGGSLGMSDEVRSAADYTLSFGSKTYPHRLMRVILAEQIYRACKISVGETYHK
ncbi:MAG: 23S rRNA (pseudouridine(1915)-N(3))-methyltransferase RlmH [Clostridiales Family XIII bacterium]|jgi:23S rRNA (pseudouridine1915-N3)-methyltransferase|nr:23S rRNA (pseudouridine(1915)-N(3))-methyltransferase RlmH [Clostridiales Family XIII bacterium]